MQPDHTKDLPKDLPHGEKPVEVSCTECAYGCLTRNSHDSHWSNCHRNNGSLPQRIAKLRMCRLFKTQKKKSAPIMVRVFKIISKDSLKTRIRGRGNLKMTMKHSRKWNARGKHP